MKRISLTQGKYALVDDEDHARLSRHKWRALRTRPNVWYVACYIRKKDGTRTTSYMHRVILNVPIGMQVDHVNGNRLDNRRANLRVCNNAANQQNQGLTNRNSSGYRGVSLRKDRITKPWHACIKVNKQTIYLGCYRTPKAAARAYDKAALKYHGEFARTNEMLELL